MNASKSPPLLALAGAAMLSFAPVHVLAQEAPPEVQATPPEQEVAGQARTGYAWGEGEEAQASGPAAPPAHRYARIFASLGAGISFRLYYDDYPPANGGLGQDPIAPAYLQLRGAYFFEGEGDFQHGVGLGVATNLVPDPPAYEVGFNAFAQWTIAPTYSLRYWAADEVQLIGSFGVPFALSGDYQAIGLELTLGGIFKIFNGAGLYANVVVSTYFASFVNPLISLDGGIVFDYELLP
jgi:hypothetical protein